MRTSLHRRPVGTHGGIRSPGILSDSWRALETENLFLWGLSEEKLEGGSFIGDPEGYAERALETGIPLHRGPAGEPERESFTKDFERWMKGALGMEHLSRRELCEGNLEGGGLLYW